MATSGTHAFGLTVANVIDEGFERCGLDPSSLTARHLISAQRSLNLAYREIENRTGIEFLRDTVQVSLAAGEYAVALPAGTIDLLSAVITKDGTDFPMTLIARHAWLALPDKDQTGFPSQYFVDQQSPADTTLLPDLAASDTPALVVWPAADQAYTITAWRVRTIEDAGALSNDVAVRTAFQEAICAAMAWKLAVKFAADRAVMLKAEFVEQAAMAAQSERRSGVVTIGVSRRGNRARRL